MAPDLRLHRAAIITVTLTTSPLLCLPSTACALCNQLCYAIGLGFLRVFGTFAGRMRCDGQEVRHVKCKNVSTF